MQRRLLWAVAPFVVITVVGLVKLWPSGADLQVGAPGVGIQRYGATVVMVDEGACESPSVGVELVCSVVGIRLDEGPDEGSEFSFNFSGGENQRGFESGDKIIVTPTQTTEGVELPEDVPPYGFVDFQRGTPLILLTAIFVIVVILLSRLKGVTSLLGLGISLLILVRFVLPAILEGSSPIAVAIVGAAAIMFAALYLSHGVNVRTTCAVLGTLISLAVTGILAVVFVEVGHLTGFASDEATFLQVSAQQINLQGLLLGGIIIGTLGVLDDVTVTQASAVWEIHLANRGYGFVHLYSAGIRIGRDHIASTVNTLVLAYAGAALPLLILFTISNTGFSKVITSEVVAEEVVRTLVGSIGLIASVPITTGLTALVLTRGNPEAREVESEPEPVTPPEAKKSRFEEKWFGSDQDS
jgi:uncharacterized membrane protein